MPVTDLYGGALDGSSGLPPGWTIGPDGAPIMANAGAAQPYGQSGYPDNLPNRPYGPPGGGVMGYPGATSGAPSMGYPALGPGAYAAPVPPTLPSPGVTPTQAATTAGLTLNSNPLAKIGAAQGAYGNIHDFLTAHAGVPSWLTNMNSPAAAATATPSGPSGPSGGIGSDARFPMTGGAYSNMPYPGQADPAGVYAPSSAAAQGGGAYSNMPYPGMIDTRGVYATTGGVRRGGATTQAPGAGAPAGNPAQTPRPAKTSSKTPNLGYYQPPPKFGTVQYQTTNQRNPPIYTAFNPWGR